MNKDEQNMEVIASADMPGVMSRSNCLSQYTWGDDCYGWNFVDTDALSVKQELMPPDTREQLHYHEVANQFFFILKGRALFTIDGKEQVLMQNEGIEIKAGQQHFISNKNDTDLEFILYSSPSAKNDRISPLTP
jgi:mannose-6-phosphate isomerase-like protein (cupin superfamily)